MVIRSFSRRRISIARRILSVVISLTFVFSFITPPGTVFAQGTSASVLNLPAPGSMVPMSESFTPLYIKGITIDPNDPLKFSFIVNSGDTNLQGEEFKAESEKLIKYFMAALTVPEDELWVNLSPYERANMIPERFGYTEMGRDLLAQDYMLKQITASIMYPEGKTGSAFWSRIQEKVKEKFGMTDVPVNMFNKIWIIPDKAEVYEINGSAYVVDSHLKVMLEEDYFALKNDMNRASTVAEHDEQAIGAVSSDVVREVLLPEIEKEVNEGKNFANLRQIYNANILATWYKMNLKDSLLGQVYVDKNKVSGVDIEDKSDKLKIYEQYVDAFKKGAYELVKRDYDPATQQVITRKYFSGGVIMDTKKIISFPVKNVSLQEYKEISPSSPIRQKFEREVGNTHPGKNSTVEFRLVTVSQPSSAMVAFSSPVNRKHSPKLASVVSVLSDNSETARVAMEDIRGALQEIWGSSRNPTQINETVDRIGLLAKRSPAAFFSVGDFEKELIISGETPEIAREIVKQGNLDKIITVATNRVDTSIAPMVVAIKTDRQAAQENIRIVLESKPNKSIFESAEQIASVMAHVVDNSPSVTTDKDKLTTAVREEMRYRGMSGDVIERATTPLIMNDMINAAIASVEVKTASLPTRINMDPENSKAVIVGVIGKMPDLNLPQNDIPKTAQVMQEIAKTSPDFFINPKAMQRALVEGGVSIENASRLTQPQNIRAISEAVSGNVDYSTAVLPALIGVDKYKENRMSMAEQLGQVPGIGPKAAVELSDVLVKIATTSSGSFSSRDQLKVALGSEGISPIVATIATQDIGLRRITLAVRQPSNSISALEQNPGGIDINPAFLKLLVKRDGKGVPVPVGNVNLKDTDIYGFEPVISKVEQVDNLPAFIGIEGGAGTSTDRNIQ